MLTKDCIVIPTIHLCIFAFSIYLNFSKILHYWCINFWDFPVLTMSHDISHVISPDTSHVMSLYHCQCHPLQEAQACLTHDPCEKDDTDALAHLTPQECEDITASAQVRHHRYSWSMHGFAFYPQTFSYSLPVREVEQISKTQWKRFANS